jgi:hypothetical protein
MRDYSNIILLRDKDDKYEKVDLVILTNEETKTIEETIQQVKNKWYEEEYPYSLLEEIIDTLTEKYDIVYYMSSNEIYY